VNATDEARYDSMRLLDRRHQFRTRSEQRRWREAWQQVRSAAGTATGRGAGGGTRSDDSDPVYWTNSLGNPADRGKLVWQKLAPDGTLQQATGPMGHLAKIYDAGTGGVQWTLSDPAGRVMASGSHPFRRGAKAEAAKRCPGAHP